jgi:heme/copper-type cytochrome/quinol oxidase subunit 4
MDIVVLSLITILAVGILMLIRGIKTKKKWLIVISILPLGFATVQLVIQIIMWLSLTLPPS